jgi:hypothetical protein
MAPNNGSMSRHAQWQAARFSFKKPGRPEHQGTRADGDQVPRAFRQPLELGHERAIVDYVGRGEAGGDEDKVAAGDSRHPLRTRKNQSAVALGQPFLRAFGRPPQALRRAARDSDSAKRRGDDERANADGLVQAG